MKYKVGQKFELTREYITEGALLCQKAKPNDPTWGNPEPWKAGIYTIYEIYESKRPIKPHKVRFQNPAGHKLSGIPFEEVDKMLAEGILRSIE